MCRSLSRVNIWKTDGGKREGAALNVYSSVFMFLSAPFREMEPYGAGWGHMVVIHMAPMAMRKKAFMGRNKRSWRLGRARSGFLHSCTHQRLGKLTKQETQVISISSPQKSLHCENVGARPNRLRDLYSQRTGSGD